MTQFDNLVFLLHSDVDRRGWATLTCPDCGAVGTAKDPKCGFGFYRGIGLWHCFVCDAHGSLNDLARRVGSEPVHAQPAQTQVKRPPAWTTNPWPYVRRYEQYPELVTEWQRHKPVNQRTIVDNHFGIGRLPASACNHHRLIVPILDGTQVVGLRGRRIDCDCDSKWTQAGGTRLDRLPLYGQSDLSSGRVVLIVENCVDAKLITQESDCVGCATYSVSYWRNEWVSVLQAAKPKLVLVCFDNDLPGNGGAERRDEFIELWFRDHPAAKTIPQAAGIKRVEQLHKAGLRNVYLYDWKRAEHHADIGSLVVGGFEL